MNTNMLNGFVETAPIEEWNAPELPAPIPIGDMPGDQVKIDEKHIQKAKTIFPMLQCLLKRVYEKNPHGKSVVSLFGGSGVGKSEVAAVLAYYLRNQGIDSYILSGDNYPHRIPAQNDAERLRIFRYNGIKGLLASGQYSPQQAERLRELQSAGLDADPVQAVNASWLSTYQEEGCRGLKAYLGSEKESNFSELTDIISKFKNGADSIWMKRMGRQPEELWYDLIDVRQTKILLIEWTHGNNEALQGIDVSILLHSTPEETLAHRKMRKRDRQPDSPFTTTVLKLEQEMLDRQSERSSIIISKDGRILAETR